MSFFVEYLLLFYLHNYGIIFLCERGYLLKEYGIYVRQGTGNPYMIHIFNNLDSAKMKLFEMIQLEEERKRPYFVDNYFFHNKYDISCKLKYFCIKEREVSDWEQYTCENVSNSSNIIFLNDFKKSLTK